jgi:hypothetical protein
VGVISPLRRTRSTSPNATPSTSATWRTASRTSPRCDAAHPYARIIGFAGAPVSIGVPAAASGTVASLHQSALSFHLRSLAPAVRNKPHRGRGTDCRARGRSRLPVLGQLGLRGTAQAILASLFASATTATLWRRRASNPATKRRVACLLCWAAPSPRSGMRCCCLRGRPSNSANPRCYGTPRKWPRSGATLIKPQ